MVTVDSMMLRDKMNSSKTTVDIEKKFKYSVINNQNINYI